jgi:hypothetical protein
MALRIETPETLRMIEDLSRRTGRSPEAVVESALREQLDRLQGEESEARQRVEIYALVDEVRALVKESPGPIRDPGDILYGEDGLPA